MGSRHKVIRRLSQIWMSEGRKSQIVLPDERRLDILIQPKLYASELLDIVGSHFKLKEKEYFGLAFQDEMGHNNWLQLDKKILEHELPRKQGTNLILYFLVRFYVLGITQLQDTSTVELFYLSAKQAVFKGQIECDSETVFELAAHVLQATQGDYTDDATTRADLKRLPLITTSALKEHPSIQYCEDRVVSYYKKLAGTARGLAIVNYMTIVEQLPTYGIHYYEVKDKKDIPWWLGICNKGISLYDKNDKAVPRKTFIWKNLENLYYRERKFSIEVHDPKRIVHTLSSFNLYEDAVREPISEFDELSDAITDPSTQVSVSRRTFGPGNVNVHAWFGATPQLTKCIWNMAVAQHQFYHDRKNSRATLTSVRSVSELASELSRSTTSLPGSTGSDISRSGSSASLPSLGASRFDLNFDPADTPKVQREMYTALKERRQYLEKLLQERTQELKILCIQEGELTGRLPQETPLNVGEEPPQIRRRLGTAFSLAPKLLGNKNEAEDRANQLELEVELQKQITNAAHKLASDKSVSRFVRKQRRHSFIKAQGKLKEMEKKLSECRKMGHGGVSTGNYDDSEVISPAQSPLVPRGPRSNYKQHEGRGEESPIHRSATAPKELTPEHQEIPDSHSPTTASIPATEMGYTPNSVYATRTQYRHQTYPTLISRSQPGSISQADYEKDRIGNRLESSQAHHEGSQDSGFSSTNNMYHVASRRTSQYVSNNDISSPANSHYETLDSVFDDKLKLNSKHGSLDHTYRKSQRNYGSLERNLKKRNERNYERKYSDSDTNHSDFDNLTPSKFGSKRTSQSEYDLSSKGRELMRENESEQRSRHEIPPPLPRRNSSRENMIELPVTHETHNKQSYDKNSDRRKDYYPRTSWQETAVPEPSPIVQSPTRAYNDFGRGPDQSDTQGSLYHSRGFEGSHQQTPAHHVYSSKSTPYTEHSIPVKRVDAQHNTPRPTPSKIVTSGKMSPHVEVSKPFEMSDFYKYSEKLRRQRLVEQYHQALMGQLSRSSTPSQHSSDSGETTHSGPVSYSRGTHQTPGTPSRGQYRSGSNSSPYNSPVTSRHITGTPYSSHVSHSQSVDKTAYGGGRINSVSSSSYQSTQEHGMSTTTSRVQYTVKSQSGHVLYKAQHQTSKQTHYTPPAPMKCDAVRDAGKAHRGGGDSTPKNSRSGHGRHQRQYSTPERSIQSPVNASFHLSPPGSLSRAFSNEMLEWYDGEGGHQPATEV